MTTLTQTYRRLAHDPEHCACHRCEKINRSELLRFAHANGWWIALTAFTAMIGYGVILWALRAFPGFTRIG